MNQLLVVGAGATIEECRRSGNRPDDPDWDFPVMANFCSKLFDRTSTVLTKATTSYLSDLRIPYQPKLLNLKAGDFFSSEDIRRGPIGVFLQLEAQAPGDQVVSRQVVENRHIIREPIPVWTLIGIGGHLAMSPLPHHRAYGSVPRRFGRLSVTPARGRASRANRSIRRGAPSRVPSSR